MNSMLELLNYATKNRVILNLLVTLIFLFFFALLCMRVWNKFLYPFVMQMIKQKEEEEAEEKIIKAHTESIEQIRKDFVALQEQMTQGFNEIKKMNTELSNYNDRQTSVIRNQLRYSLTRSCNECLENEKISSSELNAVLDLYESYKGLSGNSYVKLLITKIKELEIVNDGTEKFLCHREDYHNEG